MWSVQMVTGLGGANSVRRRKIAVMGGGHDEVCVGSMWTNEQGEGRENGPERHWDIGSER